MTLEVTMGENKSDIDAAHAAIQSARLIEAASEEQSRSTEIRGD
jgi:hypothetical protein